jgi:hypothetical protein
MSANDILTNNYEVSSKKSNVTFDFGHLLINDTQPFKNNGLTETEIINRGKENLALFFEELFKLRNTQAGDDDELRNFSKTANTVTLPKPVTILPRSKPIPKKQALTKWEKFRLEKGLPPKRKRGRFEYSEELKKWAPRHGKGR